MLVDAPWAVSEAMLASFNIQVVVRGAGGPAATDADDPFRVPRARGLFKLVTSSSSLNSAKIADRIQARRGQLLARYHDKAQKEADYYRDKDAKTA